MQQIKYIIIVRVPQITNNRMLLEEIIIYRHIIGHNVNVVVGYYSNPEIKHQPVIPAGQPVPVGSYRVHVDKML